MINITSMIPLKDNISTRTFPIITVGIIFVNILIFLWQALTLSHTDTERLYNYNGLVSYDLLFAIKENYKLLPYNLLTIFTSMFIHGGGFHLAGNMLYLWIFGNNIEDALGHNKFVIYYLFSGIFAAFFQFLYDPYSMTPMIGASGAVSVILGGYLLLYPYSRIKTLFIIFIFIKVIELPAILLLTVWFFMQVVLSHSEGVAWFAHIGGFLFGLVTIRMLSTKTRRKR